jgi:segregation and condensation protein B
MEQEQEPEEVLSEQLYLAAEVPGSDVPNSEVLPDSDVPSSDVPNSGPGDANLKAVIEAVIYITDEPLTLAQIAAALAQPAEKIARILDELSAEYNRPDRGLTIREVAGGYKLGTKAEHHESIRAFVKSLKAPLKLSLAALETLAVIAYKQPITAPEIMEIRGVQGAGVLKTLLDRRVIAASGRKQVIGKPILYKTTKEFLVQFGLKDLTELPTLKEFEELGRMAFSTGPEDPPEDGPGVKEPPPDSPPVTDPKPDPTPVTEPTLDPTPSREPPPDSPPGDLPPGGEPGPSEP